jgi:uncharacterized protein (TIGR00661 family)
MRILSVVNGYGFGHSIREYTILNLLRKKHEIVVAGYKDSYKFFKDKFPTVKIVAPIFPERSFEVNIFLVFILNLLFFPYYYLKNFLTFHKIFKKYKPDFLISDFDAFAIHFARLKKTPFMSIFNFNPGDYYLYINKGNKSYKIQANHIIKNYMRSKNYFITTLFDKGNHYIDPVIREIPKENKKSLMRKLKLKKEPYLIMLGGSRFGDALISKIIFLLKYFDKEYFIIFGYKNLRGKNFISYKFKQNYLEYLKVSKGLISLGGYCAISEAVVLKKPMLLFPIRKHVEQLVNCIPLEKRNLAVVKYLKTLRENEIKEAFVVFFTKRESIEKNLKKLNTTYNGASQINTFINGLNKKNL